MAITRTVLAAALTDSGLIAQVASTTGAVAGKPCKVGNEFCAVDEVINSTHAKIRSRGDKGTFAVAHGAGTEVIFGTGEAGEFPDHPKGSSGYEPIVDAPRVALNASGAITVPTVKGTYDYSITKATAAALTLAAPSKALDGTRLRITSQTAAAHVITATGLLKTGAATTDTATFAAQIGAGLVLRAENGLWHVEAQIGITFA